MKRATSEATVEVFLECWKFDEKSSLGVGPSDGSGQTEAFVFARAETVAHLLAIGRNIKQK